MTRLESACFAAALTLIPAVATAQPLEGDSLKQFIAGKQVFLATPYGLELPLRYQTNGSVVGDVSGFTLARMFTPKETGRWWVDGGRLCQQWPTWYDGKALCFTVQKTGAESISWVREDGLEGTARVRG